MDWNQMQVFLTAENIEDVSLINFDLFSKLYAMIMLFQPVSIRKLKSKNSSINAFDLRELEAQARTFFESFDHNKSGTLDVEEMRQVFKENGVPDVDGDEYERCVVERMLTIDK